VVLAIVLCTTVGAAETPGGKETTVSAVAARVAAVDLLCGEFKQQKHLKALARPLVTTGKYVFVAGQGILWQVQSPYPARLLVTKDELIQWDDTGEPLKLGYGKTPVFQALSNVFLTMFKGDIAALRNTFDLSATMTKDSWHLVLIPNYDILTAAISKLTVSGGRHVEQITIHEPRGDQTLIRLYNPRTETCELDDVEKAYFAR